MRTLFGALISAVLLLHAGAADSISLAGKWRLALDRADAGLAGQWAATRLPDSVHLPGDLAEQGIGDRPSLQTHWIGGIQNPNWAKEPEHAAYTSSNNFKFPYWLTPEHRYQGAAWYQREIDIPRDWSGKRVVLFLERPHWETRVWVDHQPHGTNNALGTPHEYDLGQLSPGKHTLTIRVDNRLVVDIGENSHSVSDHTQGNWNGIVGRIELHAKPLVWVESLEVYPDAKRKTVRVAGKLGSRTGPGASTVEFQVRPRGQKTLLIRDQLEVRWTADGGAFEWTPSPEAAGRLQLWDEFNPHVYELSATLQANQATRTVPLAIREITTEGTQFLVNGRKVFFRGTLECAIFPKTGHPPTDPESWRKVLTAAKAHGLNHLRFHSWCPPEAAFAVADELGVYFHIEASSWANQSTVLGSGKPVDQWIYDETDRILKYYGNHPSFVLMLYGNEPGGPGHKPYLAKWVTHYLAKDPRRLYSSGSGWPQLPENQFHVTPDPRVQGWGEGLKSRINALPPETVTDYRDYIRARKVPVISHEIGQWCVYPNFDEIRKYTGYLKPRNFEIFRDRLNANHLGSLARPFLLASGKLQALCYKEDIESALRTPGMGGFQLLDLHDFPGQGTALVGVLDPFWEEKGYISPQEYSRFCNAVVPLARLSKRAFTTSETLRAPIEIANFGAAPIEAAVADWKLVDTAGKVWASGKLGPRQLPVDNGLTLGEISASLGNVPAPAQGKLVISLRGTKFENDWDIWVYPPAKTNPPPANIHLANDLDAAALAALENGGRVLLLIPPASVRPDPKTGRVGLGFSSIFWNTAWTGRQPPHTLGILCDPKHPAFAAFPTEYHSNWQWWYLVSHAGAMILDPFPAELTPVVRVIDDWVTARRLALVFEAKVAKGRLVVCSVDLAHGLDADPVRAQFRQSLLNYMGSDRFAPKSALTPEQIRSLIVEPSAMRKMGARISRVSSEEAGFDAAAAIDGDPATFWHTRFRDFAPEFPHSLQIELPQARSLQAFAALPRQDRNGNGNIKDYELYISLDGNNWGSPVAKGAFPRGDRLHRIDFPQPVQARYVRLVALSGHAQGPWAALAELELIPATGN